MGIDLLENSELAALAPSRLGNKSFVDDNNYSNFSIVNKDKAAASARAEIDATWSINPKYKNDCDYLQKQLEKLLAEIDGENKKNLSKTLRERWINPREDWAARYKKAIIDNECEKNKEQAEKKAEQKNTLDTLTSITNAPPPLLPTGEQKADNTNKYIIYGVGGVILLIAIAILIKK
jgi:seryl-tRNA synthetase